MWEWIRCWYWMGRTMLGSPHYRKAFELAFVCRIPSHCFRTPQEDHHKAALACMSRNHLPTTLDFAARRVSHVLSSYMNCCRDLRKNGSIRSAASRHGANPQSSGRITLKTEHKNAAGCRRWAVTYRGRSLARFGRGYFRQECLSHPLRNISEYAYRPSMASADSSYSSEMQPSRSLSAFEGSNAGSEVRWWR